MDTVRLIGSGLLFLTFAEAALFVTVYSVTAAWWRTPIGRHLAAFVAVLGLVLLLAGIRIIAGGETLWFAWLRLITFAALPVLLGQRIWLLVHAQVEERRRRRADGDDDAPTC